MESSCYILVIEMEFKLQLELVARSLQVSRLELPRQLQLSRLARLTFRHLRVIQGALKGRNEASSKP